MKTQIKRTYNSSSIRITTFKEEGLKPKRRKLVLPFLDFFYLNYLLIKI